MGIERRQPGGEPVVARRASVAKAAQGDIRLRGHRRRWLEWVRTPVHFHLRRGPGPAGQEAGSGWHAAHGIGAAGVGWRARDAPHEALVLGVRGRAALPDANASYGG